MPIDSKDRDAVTEGRIDRAVAALNAARPSRARSVAVTVDESGFGISRLDPDKEALASLLEAEVAVQHAIAWLKEPPPPQTINVYMPTLTAPTAEDGQRVAAALAEAAKQL